MHRRLVQIRWLILRLSRISAREWPYRISGVLHTLTQRMGLGTAKAPPSPDLTAPIGAPWVHPPMHGQSLPPDLAGKVAHIMRDEVPLFGRYLSLPFPPQWNADPVTSHALPAGFGLMLDFRHLSDRVDIKYVWELNRHLWWVSLAQAYAITRQPQYVDKLAVLLDSWLDQCRYPMGPNWSSPVEHGIRLLNWSIIWHLTASSHLMEGRAGQCRRQAWLSAIYQHCHFISANYSRYSSADNHLIGEAAGVFVAASTWPFWPACTTWKQEARQILESETSRQFAPDGVNLEQSLCYQKFSLEFVLAAALCARANHDEFPEEFWRRTRAAGTFLATILPPSGEIPAIGDADDSCVLGLEYRSDTCGYRGLLALMARACGQPELLDKSLRNTASEQWLFPTGDHPTARQSGMATAPQLFRQGGYAILGSALHSADELRAIFDIGSLGLNGVAGHGHADTLALLLSYRCIPLLVDSGTYCYNTHPGFRRHFRGTAAHNTVVVDGLDQARYGGSFLWLSDIETTLERSLFDPEFDHVAASHDGYRHLADPVRHHRSVVLDKTRSLLLVEDWLTCKKPHDIAIYWHFHPSCHLDTEARALQARHGPVKLSMECRHPTLALRRIDTQSSQPAGWISPKFGLLQRAPTVVFTGTVAPGERVVTRMRIADAQS